MVPSKIELVCWTRSRSPS